MKLIFGLGNPGIEYALTRHNIGYWVIDRLAEKNGIQVTKQDPTCVYGSGRICAKKVLLIKPTNYMNNSGRAVKRAIHHLAGIKVSPEDILVIHDDIDLQLGRIKLKQGGQDAGHRGLISIRAHYGEDYLRIRLGIGRPLGNQDVTDYVLEPFRKEEKEIAETLVEKACEALQTLLVFGLTKAQNQIHG